MKRPFFTPELKAIKELRKLVYFLAENTDVHALWGARARAGIEHLDLRGDTNKQIIVNLLIDSQRYSTLDKLIECIIDDEIIGDDFIDLSSFRVVNYELPSLDNISFEVPRDSSCHIEDSIDGSISYKHLIEMRSYEGHKCQNIKYCSICGKQLGTEDSHDWGNWYYLREDSCRQERICNNCRESESRVKHDWSKWTSNSNGSQYRICNHCNKEEFNIDGQWRGFVHWSNGGKDYWELTIKTSGFLWDTIKAEIKVYVNISSDNQCEYILLQKAVVNMEDGKVVIKGKKIISTTDGKKKYNLDRFEGVIGHECQYIEGSVCDGSLNGKLKLHF